MHASHGTEAVRDAGDAHRAVQLNWAMCVDGDDIVLLQTLARPPGSGPADWAHAQGSQGNAQNTTQEMLTKPFKGMF